MAEERSSHWTRPLPYASTSPSIHSFPPLAHACTTRSHLAVGLQLNNLQEGLCGSGDGVTRRLQPRGYSCAPVPLHLASAVQLHRISHAQHRAAGQLQRGRQQHLQLVAAEARRSKTTGAGS